MIVKAMPKNIDMDEIDTNPEEVSKEVLIIAQEIKIVKSLACNDLNKRNRQLKRLNKWLQLRVKSSFPFTQEDFRRIWKGLYFTMWMSDKPLVQEELAEQLGKLLLCFEGNIEAGANFFGAFLYTMCLQWFGVDQWRIDKFMMLVRRMLRCMLRVLKDAGWPSDGINIFNEHLTQTVFADKIGAAGLTMHFLDIFCEELAKVANGDITSDQVGQFIRPFVRYYCTNKDCKLTSHCRTRIFYHLLYQSSLGREYMDKYNAWKEMGFPTTSINDLEKAEQEDAEMDEVDESPTENQNQLDPRAGNVDVFMPELPLDAKYIIDALETFINKNECNTKRRNLFRKLVEIFKNYQNGEFPLGVKKMPLMRQEPKEEMIAEKMNQLDEVETELFGVGRKLKQLNKRKRRKLLKSLNFDNIDEDNYDKVVEQSFPANLMKQRKRKAKDQLMNGWIEEEINEEELEPKKKKSKKDKKLKNSKLATEKADDSIIEQSELKSNKEILTNGFQDKKKKVNKNEDKQTKINKTENKATSTPLKTKTPKLTEIAKSPVNSEKPQKETANEWGKPLEDGEVEYFLPSRKLKLKKANSDLVLNPLAMKKKLKSIAKESTPKPIASTLATNSPKTPISVKRVKIALKNNTAQNPSEYIRQVKCSPNVPYDANKKPGKGLLKPHSMPSPINPFYKKKIGLRLLNDTM